MIIEKNSTLADKNWFRTGGRAKRFLRPTSYAEFKNALIYAHESRLEVIVLGLGANVLISDAGIDGMVIRPEIIDIELVDQTGEYGFVKAGAGVTIHQLIEWCLDHGMIGLEEFSAIPATVGGAVYNNLHYFEHSLSEFIMGGEIIYKDTYKIESVAKEWFCFGYDESRLHNDKHILLSATFRFNKDKGPGIHYARGRRSEIIRHRIKRYPMAYTCGCFFRNFKLSEIKHEIDGKKITSVAYYFDKLGYKGTLRVGDAVVSAQHANMIVHTGKSTSTEIIELARMMQEGVQREFEIVPQPECCLLGFKKYPLL